MSSDNINDFVKIYSHSDETFYEVQPGGESNTCTCQVTLPPNDTDDNIQHKFEVYIKDKPTGESVNITVLNYTFVETPESTWTILTDTPSKNTDTSKVTWGAGDYLYYLEANDVTAVTATNYPLLHIYNTAKQTWKSIKFGVGAGTMEASSLFGSIFIPCGCCVLNNNEVLITYKKSTKSVSSSHTNKQIYMLRYNMNSNTIRLFPTLVQPGALSGSIASDYPVATTSKHWVFKYSADEQDDANIYVITLPLVATTVQTMNLFKGTYKPATDDYTWVADTHATARSITPSNFVNFNILSNNERIYPLANDYKYYYDMKLNTWVAIDVAEMKYKDVDVSGEPLVNIPNRGTPIIINDSYIYSINGSRINKTAATEFNGTDFTRLKRDSKYISDLAHSNFGASTTATTAISNYIVHNGCVYNIATKNTSQTNNIPGKFEVYVLEEFMVRSIIADKDTLYKEGGNVTITVSIFNNKGVE